MKTVTVVIELDDEAYVKYYGPGSTYWHKYHSKWDYTTNPKTHLGEEPASEWWMNKDKQWLENILLDSLNECFTDWGGENEEGEHRSWFKLTIDGKAQRECCATLEGQPHKSYCHYVTGPESTEAQA